MKIHCLIGSVVASLVFSGSLTWAEDSNSLVPASLITGKDLPEVEPGKPVWETGRGVGITYYKQWVYVVSQAEYVLQFECDPVTAKLTYKKAIPLGYDYKDNVKKTVQIFCWIRKTDDHQAKLVIFYGDHDKGFSSYGIDPKSGELTLEGTQVPAVCDHHNATQIMGPDQQHFFYGGRFLDKIDWYRFGADGMPVADGGFKLQSTSAGNGGMSSGCVMNSPDWKHLYQMVFQCPDNDFKNDKAPYIETYAMDVKTHAGTYLSSLELPVPETVKGRISGALEPLSPDGRFAYAFFTIGESYYCYTLARDPNSGALSIVSKSPVVMNRLRTLPGMPWGRQDRFNYTPDGRDIYCSMYGPMGHISRNVETGELTVLPQKEDAGTVKQVLDSENGILFTAGEKIGSYKIGVLSVKK